MSRIYNSYYSSRDSIDGGDSFKAKHSFENRCKESKTLLTNIQIVFQ